MSHLKVVANNSAASTHKPPRALTLEQHRFLRYTEQKGVSVLARLEAENILVGNISNFQGATSPEQKLMREEAQKRRIVRPNGDPL